jgi:hypothetical protein
MGQRSPRVAEDYKVGDVFDLGEIVITGEDH